MAISLERQFSGKLFVLPRRPETWACCRKRSRRYAHALL